MALTKITANIIEDGAITASALSDNSIGITQLNVSDGTAGQFLKTDGSGTLSFDSVPAGYTDSDVDTKLAAGVGNILTTGYIAGPATFTIDPAAVGDNTGTLVVAGNLQVDGTTTTINSTTMTVDDLNITLASGAANAAAANGAGITVDGASATLLYQSTPDAWSFNKNVGIGAAPTNFSNYNNLDVRSKNASGGAIIGIHDTDGVRVGGISHSEASPALDIEAFNSNPIRFFTSSEAMRITSAGSVGIGADSPSTKLEILDANGVGLRFGDVASTPSSQTAGYVGMSTSAYSGNNGDLVLIPRTSSTSRILLMEGNVGIGTTSPENKLHISGNLTIDNSSNAPYIDFVENADTTDSKARIAMDQIDGSNGQLLFYNEISGTLGERLRILGNNLHLNGSADSRIQLGSGGAGANSTSNNTVHIRGDNTSLKFMAASGGDTIFEQNGTSRFVFGTNDWYFGNYTNATETLNFRTSSNGTTKFNFYDANSTEGCYIKHTGQTYGAKIIYGARWDDDEDWMAIDLRQSSAGGGYDCRVGIGTTSPAVPLVIQVSASQINAEMRFQSGAYLTDHFKLYANQQGRFYVQNVSTSSGVYLAYNANSWTSASDERIKENIVELENVLPKISNLRAVKYNFIEDEENTTKIGFIAQDWQTDFSEVVSDSIPEELGMNYTETIPVLLKAIQEQQTIIDDLTARIETLENP